VTTISEIHNQNKNSTYKNKNAFVTNFSHDTKFGLRASDSMEKTTFQTAQNTMHKNVRFFGF
jgi:hypothetical protein